MGTTRLDNKAAQSIFAGEFSNSPMTMIMGVNSFGGAQRPVAKSGLGVTGQTNEPSF